jgi:hypothetical protein
MAIKPPKPISVEPAKPLKPDASPDIVPQPPPIIGDDHGEAEHDTFDKLTDSANKETLTASLLLASQEICSYPHAMLKDAIEDLIASGRIDQNKVIAIAYAAQSWSAKETRVKATLCPGVIKIINENTRQRQQDGAQ